MMLRYNDEIWQDLSYDEKMAYKLANEFTKKCKAIGNHRKWIASAESKVRIHPDSDERPGDKIRNSKNFKYFMDVWDMYKSDQNFDINIFIDSVFRNMPRGTSIYPAQLRTKKVYNNYKEFRMRLKMSERVGSVKRIMEDLVRTYKTISRRLDKKDLTEDDFYSFFNDIPEGSLLSDGVLFAMQEMLSPYYLAVSKSFRKAYFNMDKDVQDEIIDKDKLENIKALVRLKTRVHGFAIRIFGKDIIR